MDVIPLDASLVKGSHGRKPEDQKEWPVLIGGRRDIIPNRAVASTDVFNLLLRHVQEA